MLWAGFAGRSRAAGRTRANLEGAITIVEVVPVVARCARSATVDVAAGPFGGDAVLTCRALLEETLAVVEVVALDARCAGAATLFIAFHALCSRPVLTTCTHPLGAHTASKVVTLVT